nr:reverse transcriptase domain-containing protein [Tanacetum cinerariifolium]
MTMARRRHGNCADMQFVLIPQVNTRWHTTVVPSRVISDHSLILMPEFGPEVTPGARLTRAVTCVQAAYLTLMTGPTPEPTTPNQSPSLQDQIINHVSSLETLIKQHNEKSGTLITPIRLNFGEEVDTNRGNDKEKGGVGPPNAHEYKSIRRLHGPGRPHLPLRGGCQSRGMETPVWCGMFQQTLDGPARGWFDRMPNGSINSWSDLREKFVERFALRRRRSKDPTEVSKIVRKANESLPDFKERWTEKMGYIQGVPEVMQISAFMSNSKCLELARRFVDQVPQTVTEMMKRVDDFVKSDEAFKSTELPKGEQSEKGHGVPYKGFRPPRAIQGGGPPRGEGYNAYNRRDHYLPYVPPRQMGRRPKEILATELQLQLPPPSPLIGTPKKENMDKYCNYHGEKGHYTNDCFQLKRQLEIVLESGKLNHLVKDVRQRGRNRGRQGGNGSTHGKIINMVYEVGKNRKRKCRGRWEEDWMSAPITFPSIPSDDVSDEPLIVEAEIEGYLVRRVFVDQGAAVQVMFEHCFRNFCPAIQARVSRTHMELVGFSGEQLRTIKKIELEVVFRNEGLSRRTMMKFTVSTTHAMIKFPTPKGIATLVPRRDAIFECRQIEVRQASPEEPPEKKTGEKKKKARQKTGERQPRKKQSSDERSGGMAQSGDSKAGTVPHMDIKPGPSKKEPDGERYDNGRDGDVRQPEEDQHEVEPEKDQHEVEPEKVLVWGQGRKVPRIYGHIRRNMSQPQEDKGGGRYAIPKDVKRKAKPKWKARSAKPLSISREAVSGALMADRRGKQTPIRYVSRTLHEAEKNYTPLEKLALCLLHVSRRLRRYFEAHPIKVITNQPIKQILNKLEASGKPAKYAVELGAYNIAYMPRNVIKGQVLADFLNEVPVGSGNVEVCSLANNTKVEEWTLFTDGASSLKGAGAGLVLIDPTGTEYTYAILLNFASNNNEAKYEALLAGLRIAGEMKVKVDSKLVACQMNGEFVASSDGMTKYLMKAKELSAGFKEFSIENVPRNQNQKADVLSKLSSVAFNHLTKEILVEVLNAKSVEVQEVNAIVEEEGNNRMTPIIKCIEEGIWPEDENEARALRMKIGQYVMEEGILFKKSYLSPMLRCVGPLQANYIIREIHEGACGMHAGARSVVAKIMRQGYYWPSMHGDTKEVVDRCDSCQIHGPVWFVEGNCDRQRYTAGNDPFKSWCEKWKIKQMNTAVAHPQANGLVKRANKSLMHGLKARLGRERVGWVDELPNILWAHRTMLKTSNGETSFNLTYGSKAVIPAKIGMPTCRTIQWNEALNEEEMQLYLDLIQERRERRFGKQNTKRKWNSTTTSESARYHSRLRLRVPHK